jgi:lysine 2,3-aminomutase
MGGGGKRDAHSFEHYDREHGIAVFTSPAVKPGVKFLYFDPLLTLSESARHRWSLPAGRDQIISGALDAVE